MRVHFREPLCRGPRIDYRRNIYDRLYVIYRRSQKLRFRISKVDRLSSISFFIDYYRNFSLSFLRMLEKTEYTFASKCTQAGIIWAVLARANVIEHFTKWERSTILYMQRRGSKLQGWPSQGPLRVAFSPPPSVSPVIPRPSFPSYPRYEGARTEEMEDKGRKEEKGGWKKEDARKEREQVSGGIAIGSVPIPPGRYADLKFNAMKRLAFSSLPSTPLCLSLLPIRFLARAFAQLAKLVRPCNIRGL